MLEVLGVLRRWGWLGFGVVRGGVFVRVTGIRVDLNMVRPAATPSSAVNALLISLMLVRLPEL